VGHLHLRWINPLPRGLEEIFERYDRIVVPELNFGQLVRVLRDRFLVDARPISQVRGQPFKVEELTARIRKIVEEGK
jgi:2-oxoglutarate ferredoxin oxidoreductase subunit alpha